MNNQKVFAKMLKAKAGSKDVSVVTGYENAKELLKYMLALPDTQIDFVELASPDWKGYCNPFVLTLSADGSVFCQEAISEDGNTVRGDGLYLIDTVAIGTHLPEEFVLAGEGCKIKLIGGD